MSVGSGVVVALSAGVLGALHLAGAPIATTVPFVLVSGLFTMVMIFATLAWSRSGRQTVEQFGADSRLYVIQWGVRIWSVCLVAGIAFQYLGETRSSMALGALVRAFGAAALVADVLITRLRVTRLIAGLAQPTPEQRLQQHEPGDWDAAAWDPAVHAEIERRGRPVD
ncbi:hypothetical protein [Actinoplanes philippinensis]|uniref:hypothetical protein n=1 Tax=Actinoplanes philippinensis TaxID=35752 RepID=UPI003405C6BA